jgi:hypothetical protein
MPLSFPYHFAIVMYDENGAELGTVPVERDWEPAFEYARFYYQRKGELSLDGSRNASVLPLWDSALGEPYCRGYCVQLVPTGKEPFSYDFSKRHFHDFARAVASLYIGQQKLREGERFAYEVVAHQAPPEAAYGGAFQVTELSTLTPVQEGSLEEFLARSKPEGESVPVDIPVFVTSEVLDQARWQTRRQEGIETGGILIGSLWRDKHTREMFAEVTAQIPAEHTSGTKVKLTFTPQTWVAADAARKLRGRGEVYLGYWHSHPVREWCKGKNCTLEAQRVCPFAKDFFSPEDQAVMRAAFPRAWCVGLVANDTAFTDLTFSMFGNREGTMQPRGFHTLREANNGT